MNFVYALILEEITQLLVLLYMLDMNHLTGEGLQQDAFK